jgi:hypothetical protein
LSQVNRVLLLKQNARPREADGRGPSSTAS